VIGDFGMHVTDDHRMLLSGNEALALAACDGGISLGTGYPGTPSSEILERFSDAGGRSQWAPNEKVALEVGIGAAFGGARVLVTMKHVGVNVAADPFFSVAYTGTGGALVIVSADDPGMHSSQNEQDNRWYAKSAGMVTLEPSDSQECYDMLLAAVSISERWRSPVMLRMTTRTCHSKGVVRRGAAIPPPDAPKFERDIKGRVMVPGHARPVHRRMRARLAEIAAWNEFSDLNRRFDGTSALGIITSGVSFVHAREANPNASILKLGMTYPLPVELVGAFADTVERCVVIEEGDPYLVESLRAAGCRVEGKPEQYRFGELNVERVRRILAADTSPEPEFPPGVPPRLCPDCGHRAVFQALAQRDCIVSGDIGCYTLGALAPLDAMDLQLCMGASIGMGLGLRHALPAEEARRVVSVIGDSTFVHGGITGLVEMVYNPPETGHVVIILDNGTTAMTGMQEHPGTGRTLDHSPTNRLVLEDLARTIGIQRVHVIDPVDQRKELDALLDDSLASDELVLIVARRPCSLAAPKLARFERSAEDSS
jgi:indolepyruvate ferredoxin oxidoreductase alpha subunit